jgi:hypothetical protein
MLLMASLPKTPKDSAEAFSQAVISRDPTGNVTVRMPLYAAGRPLLVLFFTAFIGGVGAFWVWDFYPWSRFGIWPSVPIILEFAYIWFMACFAYKTSVVRRDGVYEQRVTLLPRLVGPKPGVAAICFGRIVSFGRYGKIVQYPVRVRLSNNHAYDLVSDAGTVDAARALAARLAEATNLPLEPNIPRTTSTGMAILALIVVVMAFFPVLYTLAIYHTAPPAPELPRPPDIRASVNARILTVELDDLAPPYEIAPLARPWEQVPFTVTPLSVGHWRIAIPVGGKGDEELEIDGVDDKGIGWGRYVTTRAKVRKNQY